MSHVSVEICAEPNEIEKYDFDSPDNFIINDQTGATAASALDGSETTWTNPSPVDPNPKITLTPQYGSTKLLQLEFRVEHCSNVLYTLEFPDGTKVTGSVSI